LSLAFVPLMLEGKQIGHRSHYSDTADRFTRVETRMKRSALGLAMAISGFLLLAFTGLARPAGLTDPAFLVATSAPDGSLLSPSVVIAAPMPNGKHIGFIINKPTKLRLAEAFPEDPAVRNVKEPLYLGGPDLLPGVFAVARTAPEGKNGTIVKLMPGLVAIIDGESVERVLAAAPNEARYVAGLIVWEDKDLDAQLKAKLWDVRPADVESVFRAKMTGLWNSLRGPMAGLPDDSPSNLFR